MAINKRVGFVSDSYFPCIGGRETQIQLMAHALKTTGFETSVLTIPCPQSRLGRWIALLVRSGSIFSIIFNSKKTKIDPLGILVIYTRMPFFYKIILFFSCIKRLTRALPFIGAKLTLFLDRIQKASLANGSRLSAREYLRTVDIIHLHCSDEFGQMIIEEALRIKKPVFLTTYFHPDDPASWKQPVELINRCNGVFALLPSEVGPLRSLGIKVPISVCGLLVSDPPIGMKGDFRARHHLGDAQIVLFVGRLLAYKGVDKLFEAARRVWLYDESVRFVFIGPDLSRGREFSKALLASPDPRILYLGVVDELEKVEAQAACNIFCLPSTYEVFPCAIAEAWRFGKAVIGGPAHGFKELILDNAAGLVTTQNASAIAEAVIKLLKDPLICAEMGANGKQLVERLCNRQNVIGTVLAFFREHS